MLSNGTVRCRGVYFLAVLLSVAASTRAAGQPQPARGGDYEWTLKNHAPTVSAAEIARRLGWDHSEATELYEPSDPHLFLHVPENYSAASPPGVLVLLNSEGCDAPTASLKKMMDECHLIFVAPQSSSLGTENKVALLLDIVDNLRQLYIVDKHRIYFVSSDDSNFVPFGVMDVYTGYICLGKFILYGKVKERVGQGVGEFIPHDSHIPAASMLAQAKRQGFVFLTDPQLAADDTWGLKYRRALAARMGQDGFAHTLLLSIAAGENRYPNFSPDWFTKAIHFLDAAQSTAPAASRPTAEAAPGAAAATSQPASPASEQPDRLLKLARLYMQAGRKDAAKAKLNELISRFPNEPAAATARKLLVEIDAQPTP